MLIDTSALSAILFDEPDGAVLLRLIAEAHTRMMSSANAVEAWIVADRHANPVKGPALDALMVTLGNDIARCRSSRRGRRARRLVPMAKTCILRA